MLPQHRRRLCCVPGCAQQRRTSLLVASLDYPQSKSVTASLFDNPYPDASPTSQDHVEGLALQERVAEESREQLLMTPPPCRHASLRLPAPNARSVPDVQPKVAHRTPDDAAGRVRSAGRVRGVATPAAQSATRQQLGADTRDSTPRPLLRLAAPAQCGSHRAAADASGAADAADSSLVAKVCSSGLFCNSMLPRSQSC